MASLAPLPSSDTPASPAPFGRKLRVGVCADAALQPRWIVEALAKVANSDFAELKWGQTPNCHLAERPFRPAAIWSLSPFKFYRALDQKLFGRGDWSRPVDLMTIFPPARRHASQEPVDVIIALGDVPDAMLAEKATCGVWRYCFGDGQHICETDAGVREVLNADHVTGAGLRVHRAGGGDKLVYQSWSRTLPYSVARSRDNLFAKTTEFLPRALRELHRLGPAWIDRAPDVTAQAPAPEIVPDTVSMLSRVAQRAIEKVTQVEQWSLGFRFVDIEPWSGSLEGFHRLHPPGDGFWADPFALQRDGKSYIFFEELPVENGRGHISVVEVNRNGLASTATRVLERDYHLSYPFLIEEDGELYMVPETAENRTVEIYRCVEFPHKWRRERVLLDGITAADATFHRANGRWWMFANVSANGAEIHDELHLFTSDALLGDWQPIAGNPVRSDVRGARPAGKLFTQGNKLYRPAQICAPLYGTGVALQRVTRLDEAGYAEEEERRILPAEREGLLGLHTINRAGDLSVIDAFARRPRM